MNKQTKKICNYSKLFYAQSIKLIWTWKELSQVLVRLFLKELKTVTRKNRTEAVSKAVRHLTTKLTVLLIRYDLLLFIHITPIYIYLYIL